MNSVMQTFQYFENTICDCEPDGYTFRQKVLRFYLENFIRCLRAQMLFHKCETIGVDNLKVNLLW